MNPLIQYILINRLSSKNIKGKNWNYNRSYSKYSLAKKYKDIRTLIYSQTKNVILILLGMLSASFGLRSFLLPNSLIDGGVTGISLLTSAITGISLSLLLIIINIPFILLGLKQAGKEFALKSIIAIGGLALFVYIIDFPIITNDKLLVAVFGGFFLGAGIGLTIRGGGVLDGTEILAIFLSRKIGATVGDIILIINIIIFSFAAWLLGIETALYSVLIYLSASKTVDFFLEGIDEFTGVTIITHRTETMRMMITNKLKKGVTIYKGSRGFGKRGEVIRDMDIIFTVVTRLEISKLTTEIERIDPDAFVVMSSIKDIRGGMVRKHLMK